MTQTLASQVAELEHNHIMLQDICNGYIAILYRCYLRQIGEPYDEPFTEEQLKFLEDGLIGWDEGELQISLVLKRKKY